MLERDDLSLKTRFAQRDNRGKLPVNDEMFGELLASVREGAEILRGKSSPKRVFYIPSAVIQIRSTKQIKVSKSENSNRR
jgi:hypothetical protein